MIRSEIEVILEFGPTERDRARHVYNSIQTLNSELERLHRMQEAFDHPTDRERLQRVNREGNTQERGERSVQPLVMAGDPRGNIATDDREAEADDGAQGADGGIAIEALKLAVLFRGRQGVELVSDDQIREDAEQRDMRSHHIDDCSDDERLRPRGPNGAQGRNRTTDTAIFSRMLYQLSYLGVLREGPKEKVKAHRAGGL